jgi:hypothetical protein
MHTRGWGACLVLLLLGALGASDARAAQEGVLEGLVVDREGEPVPGVGVTLTSPQLIGGPRTTSTGPKGDFRFLILEPGTYAVRLEHPSAILVHEEGLFIGSGAFVLREYRLEPRSDDEKDPARAIRLLAAGPLIDTTSTSLSTSIRPELTDRLPTGRSVQSAALLAPGTVDSAGVPGHLSIHGGRGFSNQYLIDGFNVTDPARGTFLTKLNFDAIEQTQVLAGGLDAEYGYASGGVLRLVTKSGGDEFSLDGSVFWAPSQLQLTDRGEGSDANDVGVNFAVGGPLIKRRLWFFLGSQYVDSQSVTPLAQPVFDDVEKIPAATYRGLSLLGKLKWQPVDWQRVTLLAQGDPTWITNERQSPTVHPSAERQSFQGGTKLSLTSETVLGPDLLWRTQVGYSADGLRTLPLSGDLERAGHVNLATGTSSVNDTADAEDFRYRVQVQSALSYSLAGFLGAHELKAGAEASLLWQTVAESYAGGRLFRDNGIGAPGSSLVGAGDPYELDVVTAPVDKLITGNVASVFLQDLWRPTRGLTIRPGLRFDSARAYSDEQDGGRQIYNLNWLSPRLGVAWDPFGDGKTVLRGGYFQYADMGLLALAELGGRDVGTETYTYNALTGEYDQLVERRGGGSSVVVQDNLQTPIMHELLAGVEREVFPHTGVSAHVLYRRKGNMWETDETNVQWNEKGDEALGFENGRPEPLFALGTPDAAFNQYLALQLTFDKRLADKWALFATYTLARLEGTVDGLLTYTFNNPRQAPYEQGSLDDDVRHTARVSGSYELPLGVIVGGTALYQSGRPYNRYSLNRFYGEYTDRAAPRGFDAAPDEAAPGEYRALRLPDQFLLSVRLLWGLEQLTGQNIELIADVFNLLNARPVTSVEQRDLGNGASFGQPLTRGTPLRVQLGLRYRF